MELTAVSESPSDVPPDRMEQALLDYMLRIDQGERVDREALLAAYPDVADELRAYFANSDMLDRAFGVRQNPRPGGSPTPRSDGHEQRQRPGRSVRSLPDFILRLDQCGFMRREEVERFLESLPPEDRPRDGRQLARALHRHGRLTREQAEAAYRGRTNASLEVEHAPATGEAQARLKIVRGPDCGQVLVFSGHDMFTVGRSRQARFRLRSDHRLSRFHFLMEINAPQCRLHDLGSRNGTLVNGRKVQSADLRNGDRIQAGSRLFQISLIGNWSVPAGADATVQPASPAAEGGSPPVAATVSLVPAAAAVAPLRPTPRTARELPEIFGYQIVKEIGRGGMGVVYLAIRQEDQQQVALKTLQPAMAPSAPAAERFLRECNILEKLRHPNIVEFFDAGRWGGEFFFVMEYIDGISAMQILRQEGPLPICRATSLVCQALEGLEHAHAQGYVHRDVAPKNLLVDAAEDGERCKLADFGLARAYQASTMSGLTMLGDIGGTIPYMPPEQITNYREALPPADQYAAAATLYHLLTGEYVFDFGHATSETRLGTILLEEPVPLLSRRPDVPPALADTVHRALRKDPERRYPSAAAFREAILHSL